MDRIYCYPTRRAKYESCILTNLWRCVGIFWWRVLGTVLLWFTSEIDGTLLLRYLHRCEAVVQKTIVQTYETRTFTFEISFLQYDRQYWFDPRSNPSLTWSVPVLFTTWSVSLWTTMITMKRDNTHARIIWHYTLPKSCVRHSKIIVRAKHIKNFTLSFIFI